MGRKKRIAHLYPEPECDIIVEPFAGSAAYSLHGNRWERYVILSDLDEYVYRVWLYLKQVTIAELEKLPMLYKGDKLNKIRMLCPEERWLMAYHASVGCTNPEAVNVVTEWGSDKWLYGKKYIIENVHKIRHWLILNEHYLDLPNIEATWFIDPPYQSSGYNYHVNDIVSYDLLANWSLGRCGQLIVCEGTDACWLDFEPFCKQVGISSTRNRITKEMIYYRGIDECQTR